MKPWSKQPFINVTGKTFDMTTTIQYPYLHTLFAPHSNISSLGLLHENLEVFNILLPHNPALLDIRSLSLFTSLGIVDLSYNKLSLKHLVPLQSVIIINLVVRGNPSIDTLPCYRQFMVLAFPLLWCLDGEYISDEERQLARRFLAIKNNNQRLTKLQQHLLRQADTVQAGVVVPYYQASKSPPSPVKPSYKILKFNRTRFEALHSNGTQQEKMAHVYEVYSKLITQYMDITPKEELSGDIFNSLLASKDIYDKLAGFKSLYPQNLNILFVRLTTLKKKIPPEFSDMFYMFSLTLHNFPLFLSTISNLQTSRSQLQLQTSAESSARTRQPSRPSSVNANRSILSTPSSRPLTLSTTSQGMSKYDHDIAITPNRHISVSQTIASMPSDTGRSISHSPSYHHHHRTPSSMGRGHQKMDGPLFGFLSEGLQTFCNGYKFNLPSIYYEVLRNYYGDGPITELLSDIYATTLLGACFGYSMMTKPPEYKRVLHTLLVEDLGRGTQFSFYDFHVLTEATVSWYLTIPYDSRFDALFRNLIVAISISANIFRDYTKTPLFVHDGFIPQTFEEKFQNSHSVVLNEITRSADDFAWQASFSHHTNRIETVPQETYKYLSPETSKQSPKKIAATDPLMSHYFHKAIDSSNMPLLTKSYDTKDKLPIIPEDRTNTTSPKRESEQPAVPNQEQYVLAESVSPEPIKPSKHLLRQTPLPIAISESLTQPSATKAVPSQQKRSMEGYLNIVDSFSKQTVLRDVNSYEKLIQVGMRGTKNAKEPRLNPKQVTTAFCAGQYHKSKVYVPATSQFQPDGPDGSVVDGTHLTQYDLDKIQLPQIEKSKVLPIPATYHLGKSVEEHALSSANMAVEADLVRNYISSDVSAMKPNNYERLQHADVLRFMGKMKETPKIFYPHLHLAEKEILRAQREEQAAYLQAERQAMPTIDVARINRVLNNDSLDESMKSSVIVPGNLDVLVATSSTVVETDKSMNEDSTSKITPGRTGDSTQQHAHTDYDTESIFSTARSESEFTTTSQRLFTKLVADRKRIAELPFFDKNNYKRLLALENKVRKYYKEQIHLRAITQTTYRRLYSLALKEHLQMSTIHQGSSFLAGSLMSVVDIERAGGQCAPKLNRVPIHAKRTDEVLQKNMIRHLPRMFKTDSALSESLQFEAVLSGYQQKLREMTATLEANADQSLPVVMAKSNTFITALETYVNEIDKNAIENEPPESDVGDAQDDKVDDARTAPLTSHVVVSGGGKRSQHGSTLQRVQEGDNVAIYEDSDILLTQSQETKSSQRPAVSLDLHDVPTESESASMPQPRVQASASDYVSPVLAMDGFSAMLNTEQNDEPVLSPQPTTYTESSNLIVGAMMQDESPSRG